MYISFIEKKYNWNYNDIFVDISRNYAGIFIPHLEMPV